MCHNPALPSAAAPVGASARARASAGAKGLHLVAGQSQGQSLPTIKQAPDPMPVAPPVAPPEEEEADDGMEYVACLCAVWATHRGNACASTRCNMASFDSLPEISVFLHVFPAL